MLQNPPRDIRDKPWHKCHLCHIHMYTIHTDRRINSTLHSIEVYILIISPVLCPLVLDLLGTTAAPLLSVTERRRP